ncbi:MAG: DUF1571 domain-containing protein, partial [Planctomycetales bacterium]|nr:DUF1571 domain-containing protein [Planctomycetales bacterium]
MKQLIFPSSVPALLLLIAAGAAPLAAEEVANNGNLKEPVYRISKQRDVKHDPQVQPVEALAAATNEHPLMPAIRMAKSSLSRIDTEIQDYTCTLVKRENIDGKVGEHEYMFLKVRHQPFSVYMYFLGPANIKGRECLYINGEHNNKLIAHEGGAKLFLPTVQIDPNGLIAMRGQRYPITEVGVRNLTARLVEVAEEDAKFAECDVKHFQGAKVNGRVCNCIQVTHPVRRANFRYHIARIFIDQEDQVPVRFESYDWPAREGGKPVLLEEYTYMNMKFNVGLTDADF